MATPVHKPAPDAAPEQPAFTHVWGPFAGVIALAAVLRLAGLAWNPLWFDEAMHAYVSRELDWAVLCGDRALIEPFFCAFLGLWQRLGSSDLWLRLPAAFMGVVTAALAYGAGGALAGRRGALWAGLLTACAPLLVFYSQDAKMYAWVAAFELALLLLTLRYAEAGPARERRILIAYAVLAAALLYTHLVAPFFLAALNVAYVLFLARSWRKLWRWCLAQACVVAADIPYLLAQWRYAAQAGQRSHFAARPTPQLALDSYANLLVGFSPHDAVRWAAVAVFSLLILAALIGLGTRRRAGLVLAAAAAGQVAALYAFSRLGSNSYFVDRYLIGSAAPLIVLAGAGVARLPSSTARRVAGAAALGVSALGLYSVYAYEVHDDITKHMGVYRTFDARAARELVRDSFPPGETEIWHVSFEVLGQMRRYFPDYPYRLVEMNRSVQSCMDNIAPRDVYDFYGFVPEDIDARPFTSRYVVLMVPENMAGAGALFGGMTAWLEARGQLLRSALLSGRYAPLGVYAFDVGRKGRSVPERLRGRLDLVPETPPGRYYEPGRVTVQLAPDGAAAEVSAVNAPGLELAYEAAASQGALDAAAFDRVLRGGSRWALQHYPVGRQTVMAYHVRADRDWNEADALGSAMSIAPGAYGVYVHRTVSGSRWRVPTAPMTLDFDGGETLSVPAVKPGCLGGWAWVEAGRIEVGERRRLGVTMRTAAPHDGPEGMATFSRVVFAPAAPPLVSGTTSLEEGQTVVLEADAPQWALRVDWSFSEGPRELRLWARPSGTAEFPLDAVGQSGPAVGQAEQAVQALQ